MKHILFHTFLHYIHKDYVTSVKSTNFQGIPESWLGCSSRLEHF